jgi:predicted ArsR family transcriptional regulator
MIALRRVRRPIRPLSEDPTMPESTKPDLRFLDPALRERLVERRNYWRAQRGRPVEIWDAVGETLVDRDQHLAALTEQRNDRDRRIVEAAVKAVADVSIRETAPDDSPPDGRAAAPESPARPLSELNNEEFRDATAATFTDFFVRDRTLPSPFWRGLEL